MEISPEHLLRENIETLISQKCALLDEAKANLGLLKAHVVDILAQVSMQISKKTFIFTFLLAQSKSAT